MPQVHQTAGHIPIKQIMCYLMRFNYISDCNLGLEELNIDFCIRTVDAAIFLPCLAHAIILP
jgi:hypothetical protein